MIPLNPGDMLYSTLDHRIKWKILDIIDIKIVLENKGTYFSDRIYEIELSSVRHYIKSGTLRVEPAPPQEYPP